MSRSSPETETMREEMQECGTVEAFEEADFAILYREINESGTTTLQEITNVPQVAVNVPAIDVAVCVAT